MSEYKDVLAFHDKFKIPRAPEPMLLDYGTTQFRLKFLQEEYSELVDAIGRNYLPDIADALIDLVYVAIGTAIFYGIPWEECWDRVQKANMAKIPTPSASASKRGSSLDIVKPKGWKAPDHTKSVGEGPWKVFQP